MASKKVENSNVKVGDKKEFTMNQVFAMWSKKSKNGSTFFTGQNESGNRLVGFFNGKKQNPKEPDVRIYKVDQEGKAEKEAYCSLWLNVSKNEKNYLTGKVDGVRVVGFINSNQEPGDKRPYFSVYESQQVEKDDSKPSEPVSEPSELPF